MAGPPLCVLLLPRTLEEFILADQATDLLRGANVVAVEAARLPYGAFGRVPEALGDAIAGVQARRLERSLDGEPRVVVIFHPLQYQLARALIGRSRTECELWYGRWDRYEHALDAGPRLQRRLAQLHDLAAQRSALTFVVSEELARLEREEGRAPALVPLAADSFPAPDPAGTVVAVSLGHLGRRTDWGLLRGVCERMPELVLLLVGEWHEDESGRDPDFRALRESPNAVWLGRRGDEEAARLILCADVGIVPFTVEPFNEAALPYRIIKYARMGRRTVSPPLPGARTWERAVTFADGADEFVAALREQAGARTRPDAELRRWALDQVAFRQNAPLWDRLEELGIASR